MLLVLASKTSMSAFSVYIWNHHEMFPRCLFSETPITVHDVVSVFCSLNEYLWASSDWSQLSLGGSSRARLKENSRHVEEKIMMRLTGEKKKSLIDNRRLQLAFFQSFCVLLVYVMCTVCVFIFSCVWCVQWSGSVLRWFWSDTQGWVALGVRRHYQMASCMHNPVSHAHTHEWTPQWSDGMVLILSTCHTSNACCETSVQINYSLCVWALWNPCWIVGVNASSSAPCITTTCKHITDMTINSHYSLHFSHDFRVLCLKYWNNKQQITVLRKRDVKLSTYKM